jgi:hypothetical protein
MSTVNYSDTTPPAPAGGSNVKFQSDANGNISAYVPTGTGGGGGGSQTPWTGPIDAAGNQLLNLAGPLGIGHNPPQYALDVAGDINLTGVVRVNGQPLGGGVPVSRQVIAGAGLAGGGPLSADVTLTANVLTVFGRTGNVVLGGPDISGAGGVLTTRKINAGAGMAGGSDLSADITLSSFLNTLIGGAAQGSRAGLNFIAGANVTITAADDAANQRVNVTISASASGGSQTPWTSNIDGGGHSLSNTSTITATGSVTCGSIVNGAASDFNISALSNGLNLNTSGSARIAILAGGNVGIRNTAPAYALDVTGDVNCTGAFRVNGAAIGAQTPWASDIDAAGHKLTNAGGIGIGTASPTAPLHLFTASGNILLRMETATADSPYISYKRASQEWWEGAGITGGNTWSLYNQTAAAYALVVTAAGSVGIGNNTAPAYPLDVTGVANASHLRMSGARSTLYYHGDTGSQVGGLQIVGSGDNNAIITPTDNTGAPVSTKILLGGFGAFNSNVVGLSVSGSVGIGNNAPAYPLDVTGDIHCTGSVRTTTIAAAAATLSLNTNAVQRVAIDAAGHVTINAADDAGPGGPSLVVNGPVVLSVNGAQSSFMQNNSMTFLCTTSQLTFSVKCSDGVYRSGHITLA